MKHASEIHTHLEELHSVQICYERYNTSKELFMARTIERSSVHEHGLKMISLIEKLDVVVDNDLYMNLFLQSLPNSSNQFIMNFNMSKLKVTINKLINMFVTAESTIKKDKMVLVALTSMTRKGKVRKKNKGSFFKGKQVSKKLGGIKKKTNTKEHKCLYYGEIGNWKRNCKKYLAFLKNVISLFCKSLHGVQRTGKLNKGDVILRMGKGARVDAEASIEIE
ncbi:hypothetical protein CDL12_08600 [Handroanthus impetiginosus]|uniref:Uncharacterized protein n=1 Tax=Handroanthus impetiginosus TaxID=429701 RepID=A0A2G9HMG3_9LAMI|nr:hypothetical protein CDL12_08600 [Handroanthus impetiginosus]